MKEYDESKGYRILLSDGKSVRWVCYDCSSCVICKAKAGRGLTRRPLSIRYSGVVLLDIQFCKEHAKIVDELMGLNYKQIPAPTLQAMYDYVIEERTKLASIGSFESRERIGRLNRMMSGWKDIMQGRESAKQGEMGTQVIVKEVVKIPCGHSGAFSPVTEAKCPSCGAPLLRQ
jgi:hypothetical protein